MMLCIYFLFMGNWTFLYAHVCVKERKEEKKRGRERGGREMVVEDEERDKEKK